MPSTRRFEYAEIHPVTALAAAGALSRNEPLELSRTVIAVALGEPEFTLAQAFCVELCTHPHPNVRGNAVLGLGHIARLHRRLDIERVGPIVRALLLDADDYVRGHAESAASDIETFLRTDVRAETR